VGKAVLIVDDDPVFTRVTASLLASHRGLKAQCAANGQEGLWHLDSSADTISLILCDLNMPQYDGVEFLLALSRRRTWLPILLVTGALPAIVVTAEILARARGLNLLGSLIKPVPFHQLALDLGKAVDSCVAAAEHWLIARDQYGPCRPRRHCSCRRRTRCGSALEIIDIS
jgi:CheY-like chemotaxis protein